MRPTCRSIAWKRHALSDFDVIGFSLPYEQLYTNVLNMLDLAGLPLRVADRVAEHPLILAGGSGCYNPEPMSAFFDAMVIGEGEEVLFEIVEAHGEWKREINRNTLHSPLSTLAYPQNRRAMVHPSLSPPRSLAPPGADSRRLRAAPVRRSYHPDGILAQIEPIDDAAPPTVVKRILPVMPPPTTDFIVPFVDTVHNRAAIEIQRGCTRGCRFCQAGMIFRPVRERPVQEVLDAVDRIIEATGFEEIGLLSLSSSDYSHVGELVEAIMAKHGDKKLSVGLPSLRIESFSVELMGHLQKGRRRSGFTFAPEAATDRLRDVINKPIATEDLLRTAEEVYGRGWTSIKLYFMIGHPTQTLEDVDAIADLANQVFRSAGTTWAARPRCAWASARWFPSRIRPSSGCRSSPRRR